jgi:hypothetical protein
MRAEQQHVCRPFVHGESVIAMCAEILFHVCAVIPLGCLGYKTGRLISYWSLELSNSFLGISKLLNIHHSISGLHFLRIAKFALGVRQFIAAFNDGIYSVPSKCREINFTKQGGNKLPHSMERCHARKLKINLDIGYSVLAIGYSIILSCGLQPPNSTYGNFKVASSLRSPSAKANLFLAFQLR